MHSRVPRFDFVLHLLYKINRSKNLRSDLFSPVDNLTKTMAMIAYFLKRSLSPESRLKSTLPPYFCNSTPPHPKLNINTLKIERLLILLTSYSRNKNITICKRFFIHFLVNFLRDPVMDTKHEQAYKL